MDCTPPFRRVARPESCSYGFNPRRCPVSKITECYCKQTRGLDCEIPNWTASPKLWRTSELECINCSYTPSPPRSHPSPLRSYPSTPQFHPRFGNVAPGFSQQVPVRMRNKNYVPLSRGGAFVSPNGIVSIRVNAHLRVDVTVDKAIRVVDNQSGTYIAVNGDGTRSAVYHDCGQVVQLNNTVDVVVLCDKNNKYAKMSSTDIAFKSDKCALTFRTDVSGTKSCKEIFKDLIGLDYTKFVFLNRSLWGTAYVNKAKHMMEKIRHHVTQSGNEGWVLENITVVLNTNGILKVFKDATQIKIGAMGKAALTTTNLRCTASNDRETLSKHLFARCADNRIHYDGKRFVVRHFAQSAGFDEFDKIRVY